MCGSQSRVGWTLTTIRWTRIPASSKWAAVSNLQKKKGKTLNSLHCRLRHKRHGHLHGRLHLRLEASTQFTAFPHNRRLAGAVSHRRHPLRWSLTTTCLICCQSILTFFLEDLYLPEKVSEQQYLMRYLQPDTNVSMELCGNSANVNL